MELVVGAKGAGGGRWAAGFASLQLGQHSCRCAVAALPLRCEAGGGTRPQQAPSRPGAALLFLPLQSTAATPLSSQNLLTNVCCLPLLQPTTMTRRWRRAPPPPGRSATCSRARGGRSARWVRPAPLAVGAGLPSSPVEPCLLACCTGYPGACAATLLGTEAVALAASCRSPSLAAPAATTGLVLCNPTATPLRRSWVWRAPPRRS